MLHPGVLAAVGICVGFFGSLVGIGGGFFIVPFLTYLSGGMSPASIAGTSLAAVIFNAGSACVRWAIQRRIDWMVGLGFGLATIPGTIFGQELAHRIDQAAFRIAFGVLSGGVGLYMLVGRASAEGARLGWFRRGLKREFTDAFGTPHAYEVNFRFGLAASVLAGFIAALLGVGGGWLHVPFMVVLYGMPAHVAVATSQLVLLITSGAATGQYALHPQTVRWDLAIPLGLGALVGAQIAASVVPRISGSGLRRVFAVVLAGLGAAMVVKGLS